MVLPGLKSCGSAAPIVACLTGAPRPAACTPAHLRKSTVFMAYVVLFHSKSTARRSTRNVMPAKAWHARREPRFYTYERVDKQIHHHYVCWVDVHASLSCSTHPSRQGQTACRGTSDKASPFAGDIGEEAFSKKCRVSCWLKRVCICVNAD
jgi:hypothetical protein